MALATLRPCSPTGRGSSTEFGEFLEEIGAELRADMAEAAGAGGRPGAPPSGHTVVVGGARIPLPLAPRARPHAGVLYHVATDSALLHHRDAGAPVYANCWHTFGGGAEPEDGGDPVASLAAGAAGGAGRGGGPRDRVRPLCEDEVAPGRERRVFWAEWPERSEDFVLGEGDGYAWFSLKDALALPDLSDRARERLPGACGTGSARPGRRARRRGHRPADDAPGGAGLRGGGRASLRLRGGHRGPAGGLRPRCKRAGAGGGGAVEARGARTLPGGPPPGGGRPHPPGGRRRRRGRTPSSSSSTGST